MTTWYLGALLSCIVIIDGHLGDENPNEIQLGDMMKAVIFCTDFCADNEMPRTLTKIGGISILERQVRIMRLAGVSDISILMSGPNDALEAHCQQLEHLNVTFRIIVSNDAGVWPVGAYKPDDFCFVCDGVSIIDDRLPAYLMKSQNAQVAVWDASRVSKNRASQAISLEHGIVPMLFAGCAKMKGKDIERLGSSLDTASLKGLLDTVLVNSSIPSVDLSQLVFYDKELRRDDSFIWLPVTDKSDNSSAKRMLLNRAQKSVLEWPAWFIHRPIEKWMVFYMCEWPITPNMITIINILVAFPAIWLFATGHIVSGLALAIAAGIIDGLDGKLARAKVMMSEVGKLEEVSDRLYEYGWYFGIAYWLNHSGYGQMAYFAFGALLTLQLIEISNGLVFKIKRGIQLDDFGPMERSFRWVCSRRNTNMWTLVPFVALGALYSGYLFLVAYYFATTLFRVWRAVVHLSKPTSRQISQQSRTVHEQTTR